MGWVHKTDKSGTSNRTSRNNLSSKYLTHPTPFLSTIQQHRSIQKIQLTPLPTPVLSAAFWVNLDKPVHLGLLPPFVQE